MASVARRRAPAISTGVGGTGERGGGEGSGRRRMKRCVFRTRPDARRRHGEAPGRLVAWRLPGWLGGIPPISLGARGGEEDAPAPMGRLGWVGRLRLGAR